MIKAILACDANGGVGNKGTLPWPHVKRDFQWFRDNTVGHVVVMGSTTYLDPDMPKPMPKRTNIVVTSRPEACPLADDYINGNLQLYIPVVADKYPGLITWVIGGPHIIEQSLNIIEEFYISRIPGTFDCDSYLPIKKIETLFEKTWSEEHDDVTFEIWKKRDTL